MEGGAKRKAGRERRKKAETEAQAKNDALAREKAMKQAKPPSTAQAKPPPAAPPERPAQVKAKPEEVKTPADPLPTNRSKSKQQRLDELLEAYKKDQISPSRYHQQRAQTPAHPQPAACP